MKRKEEISIDQLLANAAEYLAKGNFFLALELAGLAEWHLNERAPNLQTGYQRQKLKRILALAEQQTDQAVEEMLPRKRTKAA